MKGEIVLVIAVIIVISVLSFALISISTTQEKVTISEIRNNPYKFTGNKVAIKGVYKGWNINESPPMTRNDWVLGDTTGRIYVTGKFPGFSPPDDIGRTINVTGFVRNTGEQLYIEALELYKK